MRKGAVIKSYIYANMVLWNVMNVECLFYLALIWMAVDCRGGKWNCSGFKFSMQFIIVWGMSCFFFRKTWNKLKVIVKENMSKWPGIIIMSKHGFLKCHECWMFILSSMIWMLIECEGGKLCCSSFRFQLQLLEMCKAAWANSFLLCVPTWVNEADDVVQWPNEILLVLCST